MTAVRVGKAGQEADGGEVGGGGGGVGLRGEAARRSGAASEVAVWACGVAAAARAAATAPGLRLFVLGALGGVAGSWEARESGVCRRFSAEPEGEHMRTSGRPVRELVCRYSPALNPSYIYSRSRVSVTLLVALSCAAFVWRARARLRTLVKRTI
jgi:hypothetical protein